MRILSRFLRNAVFVSAGGLCLWAQSDALTFMYFQSAKGSVVGAHSSDVIEIAKPGETLILRVLPGGSRTNVLGRPLPGNYIFGQSFGPYGLHLIDANGDGRQEIVTITAESASLGAYLGIYGVEKLEIKPLLEFVDVEGRRLRVGGSQFYLEKDAAGKFVRINLYGRWIPGDPMTHTQEVVEWDGKAFRYRELPKSQRKPPPEKIRHPKPPTK